MYQVILIWPDSLDVEIGALVVEIEVDLCRQFVKTSLNANQLQHDHPSLFGLKRDQSENASTD